MKVWIVDIGEPLPLEKDVRLHRYGEFSKFLAFKGHEVTWWTSTFSHAPKNFVIEHDDEQVVNGVKLKLLHGPGYRKNISFARFKHQAHFGKRFYREAAKSDLPDIIIAPVPTLSAGKKVVQFAVENNVPVFTDIKDFWPDVIAEIAPSFLHFFSKMALIKLYKQMSYICKNVDGILYMSQEALRYGLSFAKRPKHKYDHFFPLGYAPKEIPMDKLEEAERFLDEIGIRRDVFTCCFFGTIGRYFDLDLVIQAARILVRKHDIQFILAGAGSSLDRYKSQAKDLPNVKFPGWIDAPKIKCIATLSSVGLAPYRKGENFSLPNKPFEYMGNSLPIVSSIQQELPEFLEQYHCGITYTGDSAEELALVIEKLMKHPQKCQKMGENARKLFDERFSTKTIFTAIEEHFEAFLRDRNMAF